MLLALVNDPECMRGLVAVIETILAGEVCRQVKALLLSSTIVALRKPDSQSPRPVAVGEVFNRLAASFLHTVSPSLSRIFDRIQMGVGQVGGVEKAIHLLQAFVDVTEGTDVPSLVISCDGINAFNTRDRGQTGRSVQLRSPCPHAQLLTLDVWRRGTSLLSAWGLS